MTLRPTAFALVLMASTAQADSLFVAGQKCLREVAFDGKTVRTLSSEAARWPRLLPDRKAVLYYAPERGELRRVALDTGAAATVAKLPKQFRLCQPESGDSPPEKVEYALSELAVQSDGDFVIDQSGRRARPSYLRCERSRLTWRIPVGAGSCLALRQSSITPLAAPVVSSTHHWSHP